MPERSQTVRNGPEHLLPLALSRPNEALTEARGVCLATSDPLSRSFAHQAIGIVLRDGGETQAACRELRIALRFAQRTERANRAADVRATLGAALVMDGKTRAGLAELDLAAAAASGPTLATVLMRRAYIFSVVGRLQEALRDTRLALAGIRRAGDQVWEARALNNRGHFHIALGAARKAEDDVLRAEQLFQATGQDLEAVIALHNRGSIAYCTGNLPLTYSLYDQAAHDFTALGTTSCDLAVDRCLAYLAGGLPDEAVSVVDETLISNTVQPRHRAELLLTRASAALAAGDDTSALQSATEARSLFVSQGRAWWRARADLLIARTRHANERTTARLLRTTVTTAEQMQAAGDEHAVDAWLLCGRMAAELGVAVCHEYYQRAARSRRRGRGLSPVVGWLARALDHQAAGNSRGMLAACARGLDAIDEHRSTWGSSELRARASWHGEELAALALRQVAVTGDARALLRWSERWRATAIAPTHVHPPRDAVLAANLAALRANARLLPQAGADAKQHVVLEKERLRLEAAIRRRRLQLSGGPGSDDEHLDLHRLLDELDGRTLVEPVIVDDVLMAVVLSAGRVRRFTVGPARQADQAITFALFTLRLAARGRPTDLRDVGLKLQVALLGDAVRAIGDGPVIVASPSRLSTAPWTMLPVLRDRPVSITPSAAAWLRARNVSKPGVAKTVLIAGPRLTTSGAEVPVLAAREPGAVVLRHEAATVARSLRELDGATLAHVAAHGRHRRDNPMFSSLELHDGPLTAHDFEGLHRAPHRLVLSSCSSGVMTKVGADEVLGLSAALLSLGSAGIVSSITDVNDEASVEVMLDLHTDLRRGADLAEAMFKARTRAGGEPTREATAASFIALGV